jgi:hypothetical protein
MVGPVEEAGLGCHRAVRAERAEAVGDRDAMAVPVYACQVGKLVIGGMGDQNCMMVPVEGPFRTNEIQQMRHQLHVGRDIRIVRKRQAKRRTAKRGMANDSSLSFLELGTVSTQLFFLLASTLNPDVELRPGVLPYCDAFGVRSVRSDQGNSWRGVLPVS